ncbi:MAG: hypothetical protein R6W96_09430 [Clostridia bacterium]
MLMMEKAGFLRRRMALEWGCPPDAFLSADHVFLSSPDMFFEIVSFGRNAVVRGNGDILDWCSGMFADIPPERIMDGELLYAIERKLREHGRKLAGEHIRYIHADHCGAPNIPDGYTFRLYDRDDMDMLQAFSGFDNALNRKDDVLACGAFSNDALIALAGADDRLSDCWQIGVDTLEGHRRKGLAAHLVKTLALEIEDRGFLPYYTTWGANIASAKTALRAGFFPVCVGYHAVTMESSSHEVPALVGE